VTIAGGLSLRCITDPDHLGQVNHVERNRRRSAVSLPADFRSAPSTSRIMCTPWFTPSGTDAGRPRLPLSLQADFRPGASTPRIMTPRASRRPKQTPVRLGCRRVFRCSLLSPSPRGWGKVPACPPAPEVGGRFLPGEERAREVGGASSILPSSSESSIPLIPGRRQRGRGRVLQLVADSPAIRASCFRLPASGFTPKRPNHREAGTS
jgi:hypothetical protein